MTITAQTYTFHCRCETETRLPAYTGSTLRGALGMALKQIACALRRQQCNDCILRGQCAYAWFFETERYTDGEGRQVNARPHPYVLLPGENAQGIRHPGDPFTFSLLLLDRANDLLPHILCAVQRMGENGIGSGTRHGLGKFSLQTISLGAQQLFAHEEKILRKPESLNTISLEAPGANGILSVNVRLLTPLRLKEGNDLTHELPFHVLLRACLRRIAALEAAYGGGEPALDYSGLVARARDVRVTQSHLVWQDQRRYSNRQKTTVSYSGLGGDVSYEGDLTEFLPILRYGEQVHIGKQTVFGLGRIRVEEGKTEKNVDLG
ncbi:MAG: hypothetical protein BWK76_06700 [Desulfobulbaceae bacterium A2]|nr:MAG: hypothetical protein BWK76_06700 [Desulfobulbaceae bacterium A2]